MCETLINNSEIVTVYLYSALIKENIHPFDSATIFLIKNFDKPYKKQKAKKRVKIEMEGNKIDGISFRMPYSLAVQFLYRLNFHPTIVDTDDFINKHGDNCFVIREIWDTKADFTQDCSNLINNYLAM